MSAAFFVVWGLGGWEGMGMDRANPMHAQTDSPNPFGVVCGVRTRAVRSTHACMLRRSDGRLQSLCTHSRG